MAFADRGRYRRPVSRLEIRAFAEDHLDAAGSLLAARHREHRAAEPLLSERFEDADATREEVASLWAEEHASGAVALRERTRGRVPPRDAKGRSDVGSERLGRGGRLRGGRARARPRSLRILVAAVGRRRPRAPLRPGTGTRRPRRSVVPAELRRAAGTRDQGGGVRGCGRPAHGAQSTATSRR